jgi:ABC-type polysaccharide/polyol phosphate transport system ATPase subunit
MGWLSRRRKRTAVSHIKVDNITVEIPLRGLTGGDSGDPRIVRGKRGHLSIQPLRNLSLDIRSGDRVGLLGANGTGKTTLLKLIAGVIPLSKGTTGRENAVLRYYLLGEPNGSETAFIEDVQQFAALGDFFDLPISTYSPGMLGRLMFAMSTVMHSDILIMDEWLGVSDAEFQTKAAMRVYGLVNANDIFVIATHSRAILRQTTNKIVTLEGGGIKSITPTSELVG